MSIDEMKLGELRQIAAMLGGGSCGDCSGPWRVGGKYLVRTCTLYYTGRVVSVGIHEIEMEDAAAIYDTGRHADALKSGKLNEVEPVGRVIIGRGAIVSAELWEHQLPEEQK